MANPNSVRLWAVGLALILSGCAAQPERRPGTIVSTNPCLDSILMEVADHRRILAISHYSQEPGASSIPLALARRFRATAGTAEEVIALAPETVIADSFLPVASRSAMERAGIRVVVVGNPASLAESRAQVMQVADAVGAPERGRALVTRIDRAVATNSAPGDIPALLWHGDSGLVSGAGTLIDELMRRAGFRNASADYGLRFTGYLPIEHVVMDPPRVMLTPLPARGDRALDLRHRAIAAAGGAVVEAEFPERLLNCGGPTIIPAMERLGEIRRDLRPFVPSEVEGQSRAKPRPLFSASLERVSRLRSTRTESEHE